MIEIEKIIGLLATTAGTEVQVEIDIEVEAGARAETDHPITADHQAERSYLRGFCRIWLKKTFAYPPKMFNKALHHPSRGDSYEYITNYFVLWLSILYLATTDFE